MPIRINLRILYFYNCRQIGSYFGEIMASSIARQVVPPKLGFLQTLKAYFFEGTSFAKTKKTDPATSKAVTSKTTSQGGGLFSSTSLGHTTVSKKYKNALEASLNFLLCAFLFMSDKSCGRNLP
jgi:hypothetical protein